MTSVELSRSLTAPLESTSSWLHSNHYTLPNFPKDEAFIQYSHNVSKPELYSLAVMAPHSIAGLSNGNSVALPSPSPSVISSGSGPMVFTPFSTPGSTLGTAASTPDTSALAGKVYSPVPPVATQNWNTLPFRSYSNSSNRIQPLSPIHLTNFPARYTGSFAEPCLSAPPLANSNGHETYFDTIPHHSSSTLDNGGQKSGTKIAAETLLKHAQWINESLERGENISAERKMVWERELDQSLNDLKESFFGIGLGISNTPTFLSKPIRKRLMSNTGSNNPAPFKTVRRDSLIENGLPVQPPPLLQSQSSPILPSSNRYTGTPAGTWPEMNPLLPTPHFHVPLTLHETETGSATLSVAAPAAVPIPSTSLHNLTLADTLGTRSNPTSPHSFMTMPTFHQNPTATGVEIWKSQILPASFPPRSLTAPSSPTEFQNPHIRHVPNLSWSSSTMPDNDEILSTPANSPPLPSSVLHEDLSTVPATVRRPRVKASGGSFSSMGPPTAPNSPGSPDSNKEFKEGVPNSDLQTVLPEIRAQVDQKFDDFLQRLCSDLQMSDAKGELIHQTLMARKMQKLDESGDYRLFKFRIQAFTGRFSDELEKDSLNDSVFPHKLVRQYLWQHPLISRFNDEGKKSKSKGNHVWTIDAKKLAEGKWDFRPFSRKIVAPTSRFARAGKLWRWEARVWDPQLATVPANFSSPPGGLPDWLTWRRSNTKNEWVNELFGIPPLVADIVDRKETVQVAANLEKDGQLQTLSLSFDITVCYSPDDAPELVASPIPTPNLTSPIPNLIPLPNVPSASLTPVLPTAVILNAPAMLPSATLTQVAYTGPVDPMADATMAVAELIQPLAVGQDLIPPLTVPIDPMSSVFSPPVPPPSTIEGLLDPTNLLMKEQANQQMTQEMGPIQQALIVQQHAQTALAVAPPTHAEVFQDNLQAATANLHSVVKQSQQKVFQEIFGVGESPASIGLDPTGTPTGTVPP